MDSQILLRKYRKMARHERDLVFSAPLRSGAEGATFVRASEATFLNADTGLIATAIVDEARYITYNGKAGLLHEGQATNLIEYSEDFSNAFWTPSRVSIGGSAIMPDGSAGTTNGLIADAADNTHIVSHEYSILLDDTSYTFSAYAKKGNKDWARLQFLTKGGLWKKTDFNISAGVIGNTNVCDDAGIEDVGDGWYKIWVVQDVGSGGTTPTIWIYSLEGDNDSSFVGDSSTVNTWVWGAQLEKTPYVTSYIPTGGYTEKDDETGVPEYRIIGKDGEAAIGFGNMVTNKPEEFDEAGTDWVEGTFATIGGSTIMPDGSTGTKNGVIGDGNETNQYVISQLFSNLLDDTSYTFSIYLKAGDVDWVYLTYLRKDGAWRGCNFELTGSGSVGTKYVADAGIESVGDGWYRCWITTDILSGGSTPAVYIYPSYADEDRQFATDGVTVNTYLWGAQLTEGTATVPYLPYYNDGNSRIVLTDSNGAEVWAWIGVPDAVEALGSELITNGDFSAWTYSEVDDETNVPEYRVVGLDTEAAIGFGNLITQPEDFSDAFWVKVDVGDTTGGSITLPDGSVGIVNGLIGDSTDGYHYRYHDFTTLIDNTSYTLSFYAKKGDQDWVAILIKDKNNVNYTCYFDLDNGVLGINKGTDDEGIEDVGDGWYRCWATQDVISGATTPRIWIASAEGDGDAQFSGDGAAINTYVWGAQLTAATGPCPYLPLYSLTPGARIVLHDGTYTVWGYIGEPDGVEAFGAELVANGDNEAAMAVFDVEDASTRCAAAQSGDENHTPAGANSMKLTQNHGSNQSFTHVFVDTNKSTVTPSGLLYKIAGWSYTASGQGATTSLLRAYDGLYTKDDVSDVVDAWVEHGPIYYTPQQDELHVFLRAYSANYENGDIQYWDDLSIQEVTALGLSAVHIYSEATLATQSWNGDQADFDWNAITSMEVEIDGAPDDWAAQITGGKDVANNFAESFEEALQIYSDGTLVRLYQVIGDLDRLYKYSVDIKVATSGDIELRTDVATTAFAKLGSVAVHEGYTTSSGTEFGVRRTPLGCDIVLDDVSFKWVTSIGLSAVHVFDNRYTQDATRQNWIGDTTNFLWNDIAAMEIEQANAATQTSRATEASYPRWATPAEVLAAIGGSGEGTMICELIFFYTDSDGADNTGLFTCEADATSLLTTIPATPNVRTMDGPSSPGIDPDFRYGDVVRFGVHWGSNAKFSIGYSKNGGSWTWVAEDDYDGAYTSDGSLYVGVNGEEPFLIRNIRMYDVKYSTARIEQMAGG